MTHLTRWALDRAARWAVTHPISAILVVLIYFLSPIDLLPEVLVGPLGWLDDFLFMLLPLVARAYVKRHHTPVPRHSRPIDTTAE